MTPFNPATFIAKFVEEARDRLKALTAAFLRLETLSSGSLGVAGAPGESQTPEAFANQTMDAIAEVLRQAHNLKGSALMLQLNDISQVAHRLEDLFVAAKSNPKVLRAEAFDVVLGALDVLSLRVEQLERGLSDPIDVRLLCQKLSALAQPPKDEGPIPKAPAGRGRAGVNKRSSDVGGILLRGMAPSLRVPVEKLDVLTNLAAEMVLQSLNASERHAELRRLESELWHLKDRVREARLGPSGGNGLAGPLGEYADLLARLSRGMRRFVDRFDEDRVRLNLITEEFRQNVIELTMVPLSTIFDAFPRAVRDLARAFNKQVDLTITGGDTELDKKIIDQIADPLVHLIRNAMDHGIESAGERETKGKPPAARLVISAEQRGNRIVITIRDDGRGIDAGMLRAAAARLAIAPAADLDRWTDKELLELIFRPGFSTRASVTDVSGRGVGMDVVRDVVTRLDGAVRIQSEPGRGTTIVLDLPLSLALLRVVFVEAGGEKFAVPTAAVRRILHVRADEVVQLQHGPAVDLDGEMVPLVLLGALLRLPATRPLSPRRIVLVLGGAAAQIAVIADNVEEEQELVFKELRGKLRNQRIFAGASILGSGEIVPILDIDGVLELAQAPVVQSAAAAERPQQTTVGRVLVVEDSLVAGELQKNILVAAGYETEIAADGLLALDMLLQKPWDLVVADVDMPHMDGFELTARMRGDARLREIPVIIVTARDSEEDRRRGLEAGVDAFIVKREFDQQQLLERVRKLIARPPGAIEHGHAR